MRLSILKITNLSNHKHYIMPSSHEYILWKRPPNKFYKKKAKQNLNEFNWKVT